MAGDLPRFYLQVIEEIHGNRLRASLGRFLSGGLEGGPEEHAVGESDARVVAATGDAADVGNAGGSGEFDGRAGVKGDLPRGVESPEVERAGLGDGGEVGIAGCDVGEEKGVGERELAGWMNE